jgi:exosortase A-associated hydrolase 1
VSTYREQGVIFSSNENRLVGIVTVPEKHRGAGVLILVGGPQYRVGSHRQFALLARQLGEAGIPTFRFDYAGMGDSEGAVQQFFEVADDITAAIDCFKQQIEGLDRVVLWGLCDAASEAMLYGHTRADVSAMILVNPWVSSGDYSPEVKFSHYYGPRLRGGDTWRRFFVNPVDMIPAMRELVVDTGSLLKKRLGSVFRLQSQQPLVELMLEGFKRFRGHRLIILSQQDMTALEFAGLIVSDKHWRVAVAESKVETCEIEGADHTFSRRIWEEEVATLTADWVKRYG